MSHDLVILGGTVATESKLIRTDLAIDRGKITQVGKCSRQSRNTSKKTIDARGCLVMPGAIDPHVHLQLAIGPGMQTIDDFYSGTQAAALGGITTFLDYTTPQPVQSPLEAFWARRNQADSKVCIDYGLHNVLIDWKAHWVEDLKKIKRAGAPSVKLFTIYKDRGWMADDGRLLQIMESCRPLKTVVCVHAENDTLIDLYTQRVKSSSPMYPAASALAEARPPICETEAVSRVIALAEATRARVHLVHLSTAKAIALVHQAQKQLVAVTAETCPQYLVLDKSMLKKTHGHRWGCCPPLRSHQESVGLWQALRQGWFSTLATDHCSFLKAQKDSWRGDFTKIPYGLSGLSTLLPLTFTFGPVAKKISTRQWVALHTSGPAQLFGLYPKKGSLKKNADADVLVWDPKVSYTLSEQQNQPSDWNPYSGIKVKGRARHVILRGQELVGNEVFVGRVGQGQFVPRRSN